MTIESKSCGIVHIATVTLTSIFDQYQRRNESCPKRLVGAIYGNIVSVVDEDALEGEKLVTFEITHAFPVPHSEVGNQIAINSEYFKVRHDLHRKCFDKDTSVLLGFYSIVDEHKERAEFLESNTNFVKDFFSREVSALSPGIPLALWLSLSIDSSGINWKAFSIKSGSVSSEESFTEVATQLTFKSNDLFAMNVVQNAIKNGAVRKEDEKFVFDLPSESTYLAAMTKELKDQVALLSNQEQAKAVLDKLNNLYPESKLNEFREDLASFSKVMAVLENELKRFDRLLYSNHSESSQH